MDIYIIQNSKYRYVLLETRKIIQRPCRYLYESIDIYINPYDKSIWSHSQM